MPRRLPGLSWAEGRFKPHPAEESVVVRVATLVTVQVAVGAVAVQEEFVQQAVLAAVAIAVGFGVSYWRRHARNGWLKAAIALLILAVAGDFFLSLAASPFDPRVPLVRLFLWLQVLHSFDLPARRDLKYSLASAVVLMAVAAVYARALAFGLLLIPFTLAGTTTLIAMAAEENRTPLKSASRSGWPRPVLALGMRLALAVLLTAALVFAAIPRGQGLRVRWLPVSLRFSLATRLHDRIVNSAYPEGAESDPEQTTRVFNPQGYVGFSTYVDLRLRGVLSDTLVMRVRTTRPAFWRGLAFDAYTGRGWRMSDRSVDEYSSDEPRIVPRFSQDEPWPAGSEQVVQTFYIEAEQPNVIFAAYRPFEVFFPTGSLAVDRYAGLRSPTRLEPGMIYSVISRVPAPASGLLARSHGEVPESIREKYLQLPTIPTRVHHLAEQLTAGLSTPYQKAIAINRFLWHDFTYNLQAPPLPERADAVDHFLFVSRQGACEAFASAMAVLLRASGVPARLVTGYTAGAYNVFTGYYEVRNSDAHAWVEMYQPGVGWLEFEPTSGFATPEDVASSRTGEWLIRDAAAWVLQKVHQTIGPALALVTGLRAGEPRFDPAALALAALVVALVVVRRRRTRAENVTGEGGMAAIYAEMINALGRRGLVRNPSSTPREFVASVPVPLQEPAHQITEAFEEYRYGRRRLSFDRESAARQALKTFRSGLHNTSSRASTKFTGTG